MLHVIAKLDPLEPRARARTSGGGEQDTAILRDVTETKLRVDNRQVLVVSQKQTVDYSQQCAGLPHPELTPPSPDDSALTHDVAQWRLYCIFVKLAGCRLRGHSSTIHVSVCWAQCWHLALLAPSIGCSLHRSSNLHTRALVHARA